MGLLSVLATATVSATSQDCMINLFAKYGGSLKYKDIKEIAAKFPTKKQFDAIGRSLMFDVFFLISIDYCSKKWCLGE